MFTGIVEAIGTVVSSTPTPDSGTVLVISSPPPASPILTDVNLGDSISVNGTCLTVTTFTAETFTVGLAPETLRRTNLGLLIPGSPVNLERAVGGGVRFGGHYVQGHVDCVAEITKAEMDGESRRMRFAPKLQGSEGVMKYVVEKGFVCVDGASLTVTKVGDAWFEVMLVAYTQEKIVTAKKGVGETVNVEVDLMGKLVEKQITAYLEGGAANRAIEAIVERVVERKLESAKLLDRI